MHSYSTLSDSSTGEFKDKGSKFIAYAYPIESAEEVKENINILKKEHLKARHHCFAYRIGYDKTNYRASDDGEPSGTAGKPILGRIDSFGLTNILVVVVRYFGGVKLGVSGLINAYKLAAEDAIRNGNVVSKDIEFTFDISFPYIYMNSVMGFLKKMGIKITQQNFKDESYVLRVKVKSKHVEGFKDLTNELNKLEIEQIA